MVFPSHGVFIEIKYSTCTWCFLPSNFQGFSLSHRCRAHCPALGDAGVDDSWNDVDDL